ncbi:hypothetical protein [Pseudonocardia pini]|uniref:hypothetical protein n=1 Tax=Pseudonocardia pini TaxID=2758030 RepID=UPI0015F09898|nr:hypothetical protein [Pseudonocardia pini]
MSDGEDTAGEAAGGSADAGASNSAGGSAQVGAQFGVVHGDVHVSYTAQDGSAEELLRVGINHLQAGTLDAARQLIGEARARGLRTPEALFHHALALLSGRTIRDLRETEFGVLEQIFADARRTRTGLHGDGLTLVGALLSFVVAVDRGESVPDQIRRDLRASCADPALGDLREKLDRHLDVLLATLVERTPAEERAEIDRERFAHDRLDRARKFFRPNPAHPRLPDIEEPHRAGTTAVLVASGITTGSITGLLVLTVIGPLGWQAIGLFALALGCGVFVLHGLAAIASGLRWRRAVRTRLGVNRRAIREEDAEREELDAWADRVEEDREAGRAERADGRLDARHRLERARRRQEHFRIAVANIYEEAFEAEQPEARDEARRWRRDTRGLRTSLATETTHTYLFTHGRHPEGLYSLIRHHAIRTRRQWESGELKTRADRHLPGPLFVLVTIGAIVGLVASTTALGRLVLGVEQTASLVLGASLAGALVLASGMRLLADVRVRRWIRAEVEEEYGGEYAAYEADRRLLADRPTDVEVGEWLGHDTRLILRQALDECRLQARDLIRHLVITERASWCWRARTEGGPPRYSAYRVTIFLLTAGGVRQYESDLDFLSGALGDHVRTGFQYGKVAAATVTDDGSSASGQRRWKYLLEDRRDATPEELRDSGVHGEHRFQITLVSGHSVEIAVEDFNHWVDEGEDLRELIAQARAAAGIDAAVQVMEAIATEGEEWARHEQRRYLRRLGTPDRLVEPVVLEAEPPLFALQTADDPGRD